MKIDGSKRFQLDRRSVKSIFQYILIISASAFFTNLDGFQKVLFDIGLSPVVVTSIIAVLGIIGKKYVSDYSIKE